MSTLIFGRATATAATAATDMPALYRSEAFAEDLLDFVRPLPQWQHNAPRPGRQAFDGVADVFSARSRRLGVSGPDRPAGGGLGGQGA